MFTPMNPFYRGGGYDSEARRDIFGRIPDPASLKREVFDLRDPFAISKPVGMNGHNQRQDVARVEILLGRTGPLNLNETDGPTGYLGGRLDQAIKGFQKEKGLKVDGAINPGGETIGALSAQLPELKPARALSGLTPRLAVIREGSVWEKRKELKPSLRFLAAAEGGSVPSSASQSAQAPNPGVLTGGGEKKFTQIGPGGEEPLARPTLPAKAPQVPLLKDERERIEAILADRPALFKVVENPNADDTDPLYALAEAGKSAVESFGKNVELEARKQSVDPDLVKAIMYSENALGHYLGVAKALEGFGMADTILPMNINPKIWAGLGLTRESASNPRANIRAGVTLIKRIWDRIENPTAAKIGSVWNYTGRENVSNFGAYVGRIYREKPWKN